MYSVSGYPAYSQSGATPFDMCILLSQEPEKPEDEVESTETDTAPKTIAADSATENITDENDGTNQSTTAATAVESSEPATSTAVSEANEQQMMDTGTSGSEETATASIGGTRVAARADLPVPVQEITARRSARTEAVSPDEEPRFPSLCHKDLHSISIKCLLFIFPLWVSKKVRYVAMSIPIYQVTLVINRNGRGEATELLAIALK